MGVLKVKDPATSTWKDIGGTGYIGPPGGPVPVGGNPGEVVVKAGPADMEVKWATRPRVAFWKLVGTWTSLPAANSMGLAVSGDVRIDPARMYHIFAGCRCINDPGAMIATAEARVKVGSVTLPGHDIWTTTDSGLWGAWNQEWVRIGSTFTPTPTTTKIESHFQLSVASKVIHGPRLTVIEY